MKPFSQACENNKTHILSVLKRHFSECNNILEVGSGTGQHGVFFAEHLPQLFWQTSDLAENHEGINQWIDESGLNNIGRPLLLNVCDKPWPDEYDGIFSANTCHIMPWSSVQQFIPNAASALNTAGLLGLYGPFNYNGKFTSPSNANFDIWLKQRAAHQGIRAFESINQLAGQNGLKLIEDNEMPANNRLLVWQKTS